MADFFTILGYLASGGFITALITVGANELSKRRQNEIEIKKQRMEILSQYISLYNRLALYTNWNISWNIREAKKNEKPIDYPLIMYYVCDFLQLRKQLIHSLGTLQFDNLDADEIINNIERAIVGIIKKEFDEIKFSKLCYLVDDNTPYHKFYEKINENENKELFEKFKNLLNNEETKINLEKYCRWYSQLIMFELTHIYKIWYHNEPKFSKISPDLKGELEKDDEHPNYYKRIKKIGEIGDKVISFNTKINLKSK
jgi:hypothetical protein